MAKHIAVNDKQTLSKLRRKKQSVVPREVGWLGSAKVNVLAVAALVKVLFLVKCAIFVVKDRLCDLISSDIILFKELFKDSDEVKMQLLMLNPIAASANCLEETVSCSEKGMCLKGKMNY